MKNKFKTLSLVIFSLVFVLFSEIQSAEEAGYVSYEGCCRSHWGLSHWVAGIKEYVVDRCLFGGDSFNKVDTERLYIVWQYDQRNIISTSDCSFVACCADSPSLHDLYCDGIIPGTLCCPLATISHIICLPFACCSTGSVQYYSECKYAWQDSHGSRGTFGMTTAQQKTFQENQLRTHVVQQQVYNAQMASYNREWNRTGHPPAGM